MQDIIRVGLLTSLFSMAMTGTGFALDPVDTSDLVREVTVERLREHLEELQAVAARHDNTRALGTPGYAASARYVAGRLSRAGYNVELQPFIADAFEENTPPVLVRLEPDRERYRPNRDFATMVYSGSDDVSAELALARGIVIPPTNQSSSDSGCEAADFPASVSGKIVLIQRGTCDFVVKARHAQRAGAVGVIIFNEGNPGDPERIGLLGGTLGEQVRIPVVGSTFRLGRELYNLVQDEAEVRMRLAVDAVTTPTRTLNVIGEIEGRVRNQTVVVGAHLDSVKEGPGINDNGSGAAALLVIAKQITALGIQPRNTVRFAFWGAEEEGLFGSTHYVQALSQAELSRIALNLNFDMLGSPNFVRYVYDGDGTLADAGPPGSDVIEDVFVDYFRSRGLESEPTEFDGRSDYLAFIEAGIPAGGLFSGAEETKTKRQERIYGGKAGRALDPCYHKACDDLSNLSDRSLRELGKAAAHAVLTFAMTREDITPARAPRSAAAAAAAKLDYRGPHLVR